MFNSEPRNDIVHCAGLCPTTATIFVSRGHWADAHANTQGVYTSILEALEAHSRISQIFTRQEILEMFRLFAIAFQNRLLWITLHFPRGFKSYSARWLRLNCIRTYKKHQQTCVCHCWVDGCQRVATSVWHSVPQKPSLSSTKFDAQLMGRCPTDLHSCLINLMRIEARGREGSLPADA